MMTCHLYVGSEAMVGGQIEPPLSEDRRLSG